MLRNTFFLLSLIGAVASAVIPSNSSNSDAAKLTEVYGFGDLKKVTLDYGTHANDDQTIHGIKEDRYNPGTFFLLIASGIMKYTPGQPLTHFLGDVTQTSYSTYEEGNSSTALFTVITDFVQYNRTKIAIADYINNCVREYDYEADTVRPIIGACRSSEPSHGIWEDGVVIPGNSNFLYGILSLQLVESGSYFIMCDHLYAQLSVFDIASQTAMPLVDNIQSYNTPNPFKLLLSAESDKLYVAHTYGVSVVDLDTRQVTLVVGEVSFPDNFGNIPLFAGSFEEAVVGNVEGMTWLVPDQVLLGHGGANKALIIINLVEKTVLTSCEGSASRNTTQVGLQDVCELSDTFACTVTDDGKLYVSTTEADGPLLTATMFEMETNALSLNFLHQVSTTETSVKTDQPATNTTLPNQLCPTCPVQVHFGNLQEVERDIGPYVDKPIDFLAEDRYNPGTFFYNSGHAAMKFTVGGGTEHVVGDINQRMKGYSDGNSTTAQFSLISEILQVNETILLIGDYLNNCIREYNYETDLVTQFIGKCNGTVEESAELKIGEIKPANTHYLMGVLCFFKLEKSNTMLTLDYGHQVIAEYDYATHMVQLLEPSLKSAIPHPYNILLNSEETMLYVVHTYAVSSVNLETFEVIKLAGTVIGDDGKTDIPFSPGPFSEASIGLVENLEWLVPDQLLVTTRTLSAQTLVFFDLKGEQVYSTCLGSLNKTETITGGLDVCELNSPTALAVSKNNTIFIATLADREPQDYLFYSNTSIYQMHTWVSLCEFVPPTGNELARPSFKSFTQYETVTIACPRGMAVAARTKKRTCGDNSKWNHPLPECIPVIPEIIMEFSPPVGQMSGGTVVTATGYIPDVGLAVYVETQNGTKQQLLYNSGDQKMTFTMPAQSSTGIVDVAIVLGDDVEARFPFEYKEDPLVLNVDRALTLASGGFDIRFQVLNINSSSYYELRDPDSNIKFDCVKEEDMVNCDIGLFPNVTKEPNLIQMELLSDGLRIKSTEVTVYPDPIFVEKALSVNLNEELELMGSQLDIGDLQTYYNITMEIDEDVTIQCLLTHVQSDMVICIPNFGIHLPDAEHKSITVQVGNLINSVGSAVFLPTRKPETQAYLEMSGATIGAIVGIVVAVFILVICIAVVFYRRYTARRRDDAFITIYREDDEWFVHINIDLKAKLDPLLIEPDSLKLRQDEPIGEGNFGKIYLGQLYQGHMVKTVAVKTLKGMDTTLTVIEKFLEEAVILDDFRHANVLPTLAVCIPLSDKPQVVLPYMANGDLKSLIQMEHMKFSLGDMMHFAKQVACGMEYLANNKFVHRDLAARNCLVSDKYIVRIADFGLSRDIYNKDYYRRDETSGVALPIKWLAIESLRTGVFSTQSDVWSYGVLIWELLTRGTQPYTDVNPWDVKAYLEEGRRLHQPKFCPPDVWEMMYNCWCDEPKDRPDFSKIFKFLEKILDGTTLNPQSSYSYIRDYTKDIPYNYIDQPVEVEMKIEDYLVPVGERDRKLNDYPPLPVAP